MIEQVNNRRRHSSRGTISPLEFERKFTQEAEAAGCRAPPMSSTHGHSVCVPYGTVPYQCARPAAAVATWGRRRAGSALTSTTSG